MIGTKLHSTLGNIAYKISYDFGQHLISLCATSNTTLNWYDALAQTCLTEGSLVVCFGLEVCPLDMVAYDFRQHCMQNFILLWAASHMTLGKI